MVAEVGEGLGDAGDGGTDRAGDVDPGPFRGRSGGPGASAEAEGRRELPGERVELPARPGGPLGVVEGFGVGQLLPQLGQPAATGLLGDVVQQR
ncbi:hypothetical protein [Saccharothrix texasensis]|uniref:hypothetical protein n=1 Tax=Saccharothrix texasensis TaxID=103734 RepID=UPI000F4C88CA|nr:hypothetical protein [Saccharothrix texasensis]